MEQPEINNYSRFLERVTKAGYKQDFISGASMGFFQFVNFGAYVYAFTLGGYWVGE